MTNSGFPYLCPKCNRQYAAIGTSKKVSSDQYPLIIKCGHTLCKHCIETAARLDKFIICSICEEKTELPDAKKSVDSLLPDLYILGRLSVSDQNFRERPKKEKDASNKLNLHTSSFNNVTCDECSQRSAIWRCDRCEAHYCNICFDNVHKSSRVMKKHEAKPILVECYRRKVQEGCADHDQRPIEFFCQDDNELACSYCVVLNDSKHKGHSLILLSEKNKLCMDDLKLGVEEGKKVQSKLYNTEKYIARLLPESNAVSNKILNQVYKHFHLLHSLLQLREIELISQLEEISNQNLEKLEYMHQTISHHHKELSSVLRDAEQAIENNLISMNIVDVVKKLLSVKELPCYLVPVTTEQTDEVKIHFNPDFQDMIKSYGKIEALITPKYTLRNESELPPGFENDIIEEIPTDTESITSRTESFSEDMSDISVSSQKSMNTKAIKEDNVFVTHIQNPSNFWVQKLNDSQKMKGLTNSINKWCYSSESAKHVPLSLKIGELYLVLYNEDKVWYRARVKRIFDLSDDVIFSDELSPFEEKIQQLKSALSPGQEILAYVYYIDFGNIDIVPISNMRTMQSRFLHLPGLAIKCALWDLVPTKNEKEWSVAAIKTFASLVGNKELMMVVIENRNDILYVDLCQPCSQMCGIKNDVPVSIRDALVFMEVSCFVSGNILEKQKLRAYINKANRRQFYPSEPLAIGKKLSVLLSHVVNPQYFYVQQMGGNARYLSNLIFEMQSSYYNSGSDHLIVAPKIGMICVSQYSLDKQWYRAQIISLPGNATVEVFYVDFGNSEILPYKKLRKIPDEYIKLPCQAIKCSLVDIAPVDGNEWSNKASTWFTEAAGKKNLFLKVHKVIPKEGTNQVILYHVKENVEICINGLIVKEGLAISTGNESCIIEIPRDIPPRNVSEEKIEQINKDKSSNTKNNTTLFITPSNPSPKPKSEDKKGYVAVNISYVETPDCIFFHLTNQKQQLEEMMENLQTVYGQSETCEMEIEENKTYAVLNPSDKRWYRACVHKINDDKSCLVRFLDFGFINTVTQDKIQVLLPIFHDIVVFAVPCNLSGIIPAGGKKWSYIACETLKSLLLPTDSIYVQKKGNAVDGLLPVDLFIKEIHSGALEVTSVEYRSVTEMLIEKGVALPAETRRRNPSPKIEEFRKSSKSTSENASNSVIKSPSPSPSLSPTENVASSQVATNMTVTVKEKEKEENIDDINTWKSAPAPTKSIFYGVPTHVGEDGCIYLHPEEETVKNNLRLIKSALKLKYGNIESEPKKLYPSVGRACAAEFSLDNCWYRAVVTKVNPPNIQVTFVDYGNSENVTLENIHVDFVLSDIPKQCIECVLHGIEPKTENGKWLTSTLDFIHNNIVEQKCKVVVMDQPLPDGRIPIKLFCDDVDITVLLVEVGHAKLINQTECQEEKRQENPISKQNDEAVAAKIEPVSPFEMAILPEVGMLFPVVVTQILHSDIVCIQRLRIDNPETDREEAINDEYDKFLLMMADLSENAEQFPRVENVNIGMACCGMYTYDDNWYRCVVTDKDGDDVLVTYVDYGNSEVIPIKRLRELPVDYFALPQQTIACKLSGIKPVGGEWTDEIASRMVTTLFPKDGNLIAKLNKWDETPEISLFVENFEGTTMLTYQNLIDEGLIEIEQDI